MPITASLVKMDKNVEYKANFNEPQPSRKHEKDEKASLKTDKKLQKVLKAPKMENSCNLNDHCLPFHRQQWHFLSGCASILPFCQMQHQERRVPQHNSIEMDADVYQHLELHDDK
jgi:hypothetical protein